MSLPSLKKKQEAERSEYLPMRTLCKTIMEKRWQVAHWLERTIDDRREKYRCVRVEV